MTTCGSKFKQCKTCDLDVYKIYADDGFRESAMGHLCERDCLLFLAECIIDGEQKGEGDGETPLDISIPSFNGSTKTPGGTPFAAAAAAAAAIITTTGGETPGMTPAPEPMSTPNNLSYNYFTDLPSFRRILPIARKTIVLQKIEFAEHTCENAHQLHVVAFSRDMRHINSLCNICGKKVTHCEQNRFIACQQDNCDDVFCMDCIGCPGGHVLYWAKQRTAVANREGRAPRRCARCGKVIT